MSTQHTQGPWESRLVVGNLYVESHGTMGLENVCKMMGDNAEANAALIAAAPELLAELSHLVRLLEPLEQAGALFVPGLATLNGARAALDRALSQS